LGGDRAGLALIYAVTVDVAQRWRGIRIAPPDDPEKLSALREAVVPLKATARNEHSESRQAQVYRQSRAPPLSGDRYRAPRAGLGG